MPTRINRKTKKTGGPYLAAAVFCDSVVEGADKSMSAVRIVDRVIITIPPDAPPDVPSENKRLPVTLRALISFRAGYAKGKHEFGFVIHSPSGKKQLGKKQSFVLGDEPNSGANFNIAFTLSVMKGGLFWFDVVLDGKVITRMPLDVVISRSQGDQPAETIDLSPARSKKPAKS